MCWDNKTCEREEQEKKKKQQQQQQQQQQWEEIGQVSSK